MILLLLLSAPADVPLTSPLMLLTAITPLIEAGWVYFRKTS